MKWRACVSLAICLGLFTGCSRSEPSGKECFRWSTGLELPPGVSWERSKVITVAFVGDTYYVKFRTKEDLSEFLHKNFEAGEWDSVRESLTPPTAWMKDLPFWDMTAIRNKSYYETAYRNSRGTTFKSVLSYDRQSGTIYFVGAECRD